MKNFLLTIEYDGTKFHGWQKQPNTRTVQGELESVLSAVCRSEIRLAGLSRTDAGVHAYGQRASFGGDFSIPADRLMQAANDRLGTGRLSVAARPGDVRITAAAEVPEGFHARHDAAGKKYIYRMLTAERPDIFLRDKYWQIAERPDVDAMAAAAKHLIGRHDFNAFRAAGGKEPETTVRTVFGLAVYAGRDGAGRQTSTLEITG
ncbi:MAG: tRNA pseudouridine synthase A, partial [Clostridiales Family XIII bacterium]|nr:tRNA pseudouridine synthase A [Clostridiales Family XIII bacterium]